MCLHLKPTRFSGWVVHGIYVMPEHRRKGIAKKAVMDYLKRGGVINRLHIIRTNTPALKFCKSIFVLETENDCPVDVLYNVVKLHDEMLAE